MEWLTKFLDWDWDSRNGYSFILSKAITKFSGISIKTPWVFFKILEKKCKIHLETLRTPNKEIIIEGKEHWWQLTIPYEDTAEPWWAGMPLPREQRCRQGKLSRGPRNKHTQQHPPNPSRDRKARPSRRKSIFKVAPEKVKMCKQTTETWPHHGPKSKSNDSHS